MEARLLILNSDPVFQDTALSLFDAMEKLESRIVRTLSEAIYILLRERFDKSGTPGEGVDPCHSSSVISINFPRPKFCR